MNFKPGRFWWFVVTVLIVTLSLVCVPVLAQTAEANMESPSSVESGSGGEIKVNLNGQRIGAFELTVCCALDSGLRFDSVSSGSGPSGFAIVSGLKDSSTAAISGFMTGTAISEETSIASVWFTAIGKKNRPVMVDISGKVYDPEGNEISTRFYASNIELIARTSDNFTPFIIGGGALVLCFGVLGVSLLLRSKKCARYPAGGIKLHRE